MPVSEALRRLSEDPAFWAALPARRPRDPAESAAALRVRCPVAGGYGLVLDLDLAAGEQALGLREPATSEPVQLGWAAPGRPHPAALRWWELELCARVIALDDPTLPHPGLVVALLSPFAPATPDDDAPRSPPSARPPTARCRPPRSPSRDAPRPVPEQPPLPLFTEPHWWPRAAGARPRRCSTRPRSRPGPPRPRRARGPRGGHASRAKVWTSWYGTQPPTGPAAPSEHWYAETRPLARRITATGDLAGRRTWSARSPRPVATTDRARRPQRAAGPGRGLLDGGDAGRCRARHPAAPPRMTRPLIVASDARTPLEDRVTGGLYRSAHAAPDGDPRRRTARR